MDMDLSLLPEEICTEIFKYMTAKQRKPFRSTCQRWWNSCNRLEIQKMEKLHLPGVSYLKDISETLINSKRSIMNLKFSNHRLEAMDNWPIWWSIGEKIKHLELEDCDITLTSLDAILVSCRSLSYLALRNSCILYGGSTCPFDLAFKKLRERKIVACSVKTLVLQIDDVFQLDGIEACFAIFPNVIDLKFNFRHFPFVEYPRGLNSCQKFTQHLVTDLPLLENLELCIKLPTWFCQCHELIQEATFRRMKTIKFYDDIIHDIHCMERGQNYYKKIYTFIPSSHTKNITSIDFNCGTRLQEIMEILRQSPVLRELTVRSASVNFISELQGLYVTLAKLKLVVVKIVNIHIYVGATAVDDLTTDTRFPVNSTVRELEIVDQIDHPYKESIILMFLKCFSAVTSFKLLLKDRSTKLPPTILDKVPKTLKCIEVELLRRDGKDPFPICNDSEHITPNLFVENLEYMRLDIGILKQVMKERPSIFFPNLRYLHLSRFKSMFELNNDDLSMTEWEMLRLPFNKHNLEGVYMNIECNFKDIFTFFSKPQDFPKIQHIGIKLNVNGVCKASLKSSTECEILKSLCRKHFQSWLEHCPSLKTIFYIGMGTGTCFCYDPVRCEVREYVQEECVNSSIRSSNNDSSTDSNKKIVFRYFQHLDSFYNFWINST